MRMIEIGAINAKFLSLKYKLPNKVIAITGEKLGGNGRILDKIPKKIINSIGKKSANQIANQILEALKNDR